MEGDEGQGIYLKQYIQRQENLLLDNIRKNIDLEVKLIIMKTTIQDITSKYEESQKQVQIQNEMMQQAANGVESLTVEKQNLENEVKLLNQRIEEYKAEKYSVMQELEHAKENIANVENDRKLMSARLEELRSEYNRQTQEFNETNKGIVDLSPKPTINKKKKEPTVILPPDEF